MTDVMYVVAAAIQNEKGETLLSQRREGKPYAGYWEFPGGKIDAGETPEQAIIREIFEETHLDVAESDLKPLMFVSKSFPDHPHVVMMFYTVKSFLGEAYGKEGQTVRWVPRKEMHIYQPQSLDADTGVFEKLQGSTHA